MKVININSVNYGSTGNIAINISKLAERQGHTTYLAFPKGRSIMKKSLNNQILIGSILERNLHILLAKITGFSGCFSYFSTMRFISKLKKINPDVIHLHNLHNCYINLPMLFRYIKKHNIKIIWTLHDCWAFTGKCPHFELAGCDRWKTGCFNCPQIRDYPQSYVDRTKSLYRLKKKWFTGVQSMTIVTPSSWLAGLVKQSFLGDYPTIVINNGIDLSVFKPAESDFRKKHNLENKFILLGVAMGFGEGKGLDIFTELSKRLDERFKIVLVGVPEDKKSELPKNILVIPSTQNQTELAEIYTVSDLFVNPTREEVFGLVNVEALACGTPVVTFNTGGCPECIDNSCGVAVEKDDVEALEKEIIRICENTPFSKEATMMRAKKFDKNDKFSEYVDLYEESNK